MFSNFFFFFFTYFFKVSLHGYSESHHADPQVRRGCRRESHCRRAIERIEEEKEKRELGGEEWERRRGDREGDRERGEREFSSFSVTTVCLSAIIHPT